MKRKQKTKTFKKSNKSINGHLVFVLLSQHGICAIVSGQFSRTF